MRKSHYAWLSTAAIAVVFTTILMSCGNKEKKSTYTTTTGTTWGTFFTITYDSKELLDDSIVACLHKIDESLSPFNKSSIVSAVNNNTNMNIDAMFAEVFNASKEVNKMTRGMFDPTVGPLVNLWGFGVSAAEVDPGDAAVEEARQLVGIQDCRIENGKVIKKAPDTSFDFSAISKGYSCDCIGKMFKRNGCDNYMIEVGGEIVLSGKNPSGNDWVVMIDAPVENIDGSLLHSRLVKIATTDCSIATSGNYRNYRDTERHGRIGHTINPVTGYPANTTTLSVTIVAPTCMLADALSTACMAMPIFEAYEMIDTMEGVSGLFVVKSEEGWKILTTSTFPKMVE